ncbi:MAG TPA: cytochrome c maturation protein CcmE [Candidatus Limnocylindria bacterium]|nr:cytochrome c maturation protein CcmE [Candidatus Limnocylindria bacterium]
MTLARPVLAPLPPRGRRWGLLLGVAIVVGVIAYVAFSSVGNALVYYVTPTELLARDDPSGETVRLGGLVKPGSIEGEAPDLTFILTDGTTEITVRALTAPTQSFREGVGAVVEGQLDAEGLFEANEVIVKHDENYVAPSEGGLPTQGFDPGT